MYVWWERNKYQETWIVVKREQFENSWVYCHFVIFHYYWAVDFQSEKDPLHPLPFLFYMKTPKKNKNERVVFIGYIHFLRRSSFHGLHPLPFLFYISTSKKKTLINFDTSWTLFLHALCSSPTLTCLSPSSITTVQQQQQQQQQPPLPPPAHTSQSVRSKDASHFLRQLRGEEDNERSRTQGCTVSSTFFRPIKR